MDVYNKHMAFVLKLKNKEETDEYIQKIRNHVYFNDAGIPIEKIPTHLTTPANLIPDAIDGEIKSLKSLFLVMEQANIDRGDNKNTYVRSNSPQYQEMMRLLGLR